MTSLIGFGRLAPMAKKDSGASEVSGNYLRLSVLFWSANFFLCSIGSGLSHSQAG